MLMMMTMLINYEKHDTNQRQALLSLYFSTGQTNFPFNSLSGSLKRWMGIRLVDLRDGVQVPNGKPAELLMAKDYQTHIDNK